MKNIVFILCLLFVAINATAQQTHSIAIGIDYVRTSYPKEWRNDGIKPSKGWTRILGSNALNMAYLYKNKYGLNFNTTSIEQRAHIDVYTPPLNMNAVFIGERQALFYDLMVGYNFACLYLNKKPNSYFRTLGAWAWAGASYLGGESSQSTYLYNPSGGFETWMPIGGKNFSHTIRPVAQIMLKYNPIRYVFIGIGGTYRYIASDFQPVSLNLSVGVQW